MGSKLLAISPHEAENQIELSLKQAYDHLESKLRPPFPLTVPTSEEYSQLNLAILHGVLCEPHFAKIHIKHLHAIVADGYELFVCSIVKIVDELYPKLVESARLQLLWITKQMICVSAIRIESLLVLLLRQIIGGDFSEANLWLCFELVRVFLENWDWLLEEEPMVLTIALFKYLRVLSDHCRFSNDAKLEVLKRKEIEFCVKAFREQFHLCLRIGRDLIRLLQDLFHVPEFQAIWKDLLLNPGKFGTLGFSDISMFYQMETSSRYHLLLVTPEMETQLRFLLTHVKFGSQKRYQFWFSKKFLSDPLRESLICDIVRFICCAHHPPHGILQTDVIPRWAVIGWLLKTCRKKYVEANVKLALFYDWLFYDEKVDNVMNIEPAMLLMVNSIPKYVDITHTLLEFLILLIDNYDMDRSDLIVRGVSSAFKILENKGVVHSLNILIHCDSLSPFLKERLENFLKLGVSSTLLNVRNDTQLSGALKECTFAQKDDTGTKTIDDFNPSLDEPVTSSGPLVSRTSTAIALIENLVKILGGRVKKSYKEGLQTLEEILCLIIKFDGDELPSDFIAVLSHKIANEFETNGCNIFSSFQFLSDDSKFSAQIQSPTVLLIRSFIFCQHEKIQEIFLSWSKDGYPVGACMLSYAMRLVYEAKMAGPSGNLVVENNDTNATHSGMPLLKFHADGFISYMNTKKGSFEIPSASEMDKLICRLVDDTFAAYTCFLKSLINTPPIKSDLSLPKLLRADINSCTEWKQKMPSFLFCSIFCHLSDLSVGEEDIISLIIFELDHIDILHMQFELSLKKLSIFGENTRMILNLVKNSRQWDSFEQYKLWGLIRSELAISKVPPEKLLLEFFCLDIINPFEYSIAAEGFLIICISRAPTPELVGAIMLLPDNIFEGFAAAALANWSVSNPSMLYDSLVDFLDKLVNKSGSSILSNSNKIIMNHSAILWLLNYFKEQGIDGSNILSKLSISHYGETSMR